MKLLILIIVLFAYINCDCGIQNYAKDPQPWGNGTCTDNFGCNYQNGGGYCYQNACICNTEWGKPYCSYKRKSSQLAGGLNIGLPFVFVPGVGNFIIGRNGAGAGQIVLMQSALALCICGCVFACISLATDNEYIGLIAGSIIKVIIILAILAGFIWSIIDGAPSTM